eukprot:m.95236 g.95236  ORF g.95236 m.95236 type:complete len:531 (+) comp13052_c0_seq1:154-1746(+)
MAAASECSVAAQRIRVGKEKGFVRYLGPVGATKGEWYGIEWDNPERGKHNGSHDGVAYFATKHDTGGSFVKVQKAVKGVTVAEAIRDRYGDTSANDEQVKFSKIDVEVVGGSTITDQLSQYHSLVSLVLRDADINNNVGTDIATMCPIARAIDVTDNLFTSFTAIEAIATQLPKLMSLNASFNAFCDPVEALSSLPTPSPFRHLTKLLATNMIHLTWDQSVAICKRMPLLQEVHLCENNFTSVALPEGESMVTVFPSLKLLNLYGNHLSDWSEIEQFGVIPSLYDVKLNCNQLPSLTKPLEMPHMTMLSIGSNMVADWQSFVHLGQLQSLTNLRVRKNPVASAYREADYRKITITYLPYVLTLNGSEVSARERQVAERFYLERHSQQWHEAQTQNTLPDFYTQHPVYERLVKEHGEPIFVAQPDRPPVLKDRLINLDISVFHGDPGATSDEERVEEGASEFQVAVPSSITVGRLKRLLQAEKYAAVKSVQQRLFHITDVEFELDDPLRVLSHYEVTDGATLRVFIQPLAS